MPDLTSASAAFARQARTEAQVERVLMSQMRTFLGSVERLAREEGVFINPATVGASWADLTSPLALEAKGLAPAVASYVSASLALSTAPEDAYDTAMAVLTASSENDWSTILTSDALALAFSLDSPPQALLAAAPSPNSKRGKALSAAFDKALGGVDGRISWQAAVKRDARTAVTGLDGLITSTALAQEDIPYQQWVTRRDERVRHDHAAADGQRVPTGTPFTIGGYSAMYPGDPSLPASLRINCRCVMIGASQPASGSTALPFLAP